MQRIHSVHSNIMCEEEEEELRRTGGGDWVATRRVAGYRGKHRASMYALKSHSSLILAL